MFSFWSIKGFGKRRKSLITSSLTACFFHLGLPGSVSSWASSVQMACRVKGTDLRVKIHQRANPHWSFKMKCFCCDISLIYTCDRVFMGKVFPQWFAPIQPQAHSWGPVPLLVFQFIPNGAGWRWSLLLCTLSSADMCCSIRPTLRGLHSTGGVLVLGGPLVPQTVTWAISDLESG